MDYDHMDEPASKIDTLRFDPHIIAAFVSPSGRGMKVIVAIPAGAEDHALAFESVKSYLATYDLEADESGKDVSRLCFLSHDPEVHYAPDAVELPIMPVAASEAPQQDQTESTGERIGDKYQSSPDVRERSASCLTKLGWHIGRGNADRTYCTRPNKDRGISGELRNDGSFFCYTDGASPLEPNGNYSAFALYTITNHGGDFKEATKELSKEFGTSEPSISGRDFYGKDIAVTADPASPEAVADLEDNFPHWQCVTEIPNDLEKQIMQEYPVLIEGLLHRGTKMVFGGGSKSYKTWTLLNLAISVASGGKWFGHQCVQTNQDVIFLNFEVPHLFFCQRVRSVCQAMGIEPPSNLHVWSLRGVCNDLKVIMQVMKKRITNGCALMCIDPIYKALGDRDENSAGDMGLLMNEVEAIVEQTGAAVAFGAHYSKGNQSEKDPLDRISGSGVFARDPDTIMGLTAHEEENCYTVHSSLRNFAGRDPFVVEWDFPMFSKRDDLDANRLRKQGQKVSQASVFKELEKRLPEGAKASEFNSEFAEEYGVSVRTVQRYVKELKAANRVRLTSGNLFALREETTS
jgi:hypothetical protein